MPTAARWLLVFSLLTALIGSIPVGFAAAQPAAPAPLAQSSSLSLTSPSACPYAGCAAGQRLNLRFDFEPSGYNAGLTPNVKMCVYAPASWNVPAASITVDAAGEVTGKAYSLPDAGDRGCAQDNEPPAGYTLVAERVAQLDANTFADALSFGLRLGADASGGGRVLARLFARADDTTWTRVQQASSATLKLVAAAARAYAASDATTCGTAQPCYINSGDDLDGGVGTGLKDAVDAAPAADAVVTVLSTYTVKSYPVVVDKPLTLNGLGESRITFSGPGACDRGPLLSLNSAVTLRDLTINDGICSNPNRTLVQVNSTAPVTISDSDLTGGEDAIVIVDNPGANSEDKITIRANAITGNRAFAVRALGSANGAPVEITGNNLNGNRAGSPVECAEGGSGPVANRAANHNYWGGAVPSQDESHCTIDPAKRLGMPAALEPFKPGLRVKLVTVTGDKVYNRGFDDQIAYRRTGDSDFGLYIVDHGYASPSGPPFSPGLGLQSPSPCSNAWDIFLPEGGGISGSLELTFKYDRTAGCLATINSNQYCDQTTAPEKYPLYWLDPRQAVPQWITSGSKINASTAGQTTTCSTGTNEITVAIDDSGRPNIDDLKFAPFMVGVPIIRSFLPLASMQTITVTWSTNNEPDVVGFYVLRGPSESQLSPISDLIPHRGTALTGVFDYRFIDAGRVNNVTYFYRLQVLRADGTSIYSSIQKIAANIATITPTPTITPTFTPRPTLTPIPTLVRTNLPTRIPSPTFNFIFNTPTPTTFLNLRTNTPTLNMSLPGAPFTATALVRTAAVISTTQAAASGTPATPTRTRPGPTRTGTTTLTPTPTATLTATASPTVTPSTTPSPTPPGPFGANTGSPWLSLLLGILAGLVAAGSLGGAWYFLRLKR